MPLIALTEDFVRNKLQTLHGRPRTEWCHTADPPGFYIETRATSPGQGTYYLRYRSSTGTIHHQRIGRAPEMDLATALKEAKAWRAKITLGDDPRGTEKAKKAAPTLDDYMTNSYLPRAKLLKRSWRRDEELYRIRIKIARTELKGCKRESPYQAAPSCLEPCRRTRDAGQKSVVESKTFSRK